MADLLNIALSGLAAHQHSLTTTGHNIANVNTPGFSRQDTVNGTRNSQLLGGQFFGTGVGLASIRRSFDQFIVQQLRGDTAAFHHAQMMRQNLDQLDRLFADTSTGLATNLDNFFAAMQTASNEPTSTTTRQVLLSSAESLVYRFDSISSYLINQESVVNQQIRNLTGSITGLSREIGDLNQKITQSLAQGQGQQPNDLLDKREEVLRELSELVGITAIEQSDGAMNVFIGKGQALVLGTEVLPLATRASSLNPEKLELVIQSGTGESIVGSNLSGGLLGGLLQFRDGVLDSAINSIGRLALSLSATINAQHRLGMDLENNLGGDFFSSVNSEAAVAARTVANAGNSFPQDQSVRVEVSDVSQMTLSDYRITFQGPNRFQITRLSDGKTNTDIAPALTGNVANLPTLVNFDGLSLRLDRPSGNFAAGDSFLIRPTRAAAQQIEVALGRPEEIALASPLRSQAHLDNSGTGVISAGAVNNINVPLLSSNPGQLSPPLLIRFTSATSYDILDNTNAGAPVALVPPQTGLSFPPAAPNGILPTSFGVQLDIAGQPAAGDSFSLDFNTGGVQDNRNGIALISLQTAKLLDKGTISIEASYGRLLQQIGSQAAEARNNESAGDVLLKQSQARRDSVSAVNLDEEAAKLIAFEQGYNASAQVIGIARSLFDTLLNAVR